MTNAEGKYTLSVPTNGAPLDGYVLVSSSAQRDLPESAHYPLQPFTADQVFDLRELGMSTIKGFAEQVGEPQQPNTAFVKVVVTGVDGQPAARSPRSRP